MTFGRFAEIKTGGMTIASKDLDIEFDVPYDADEEPNEAEITIYNLSKDTINRLKFRQAFTLNAGYEGDVGEVLRGRISSVKTGWNDADKETVIHVLDASDNSWITAEVAYKAGTKASKILKDLTGRLNLPTSIHLPNDVAYKDGYTVDGKLVDAIKEVAEDAGAKFYINRGKVYVQALDYGQEITFTVTPENGLIGSPEPFEDDEVQGYKLKLLLQHRITTGSRIKVESNDVNGTYRVRKGSHYWNGDDFLTECEVI